MKENYKPWHVQIDHFPKQGSLKEQFLFLLRFAILAPSGHNSQPWEFSIDNNSILIRFNEERSLKQSDPSGRQLLIGIGCALENLLTSADYYGFKSDVFYLPDQKKPNLVANVSFQKQGNLSKSNQHLIFAIPQRSTNRNKYKGELPSADFIREIKDSSQGDFNTHVITDTKTKSIIADIVNIAQIEVMEEGLFREELSHYIKSNLTKSKIGMPGFTLGMPLLVSLIASRLIKRINMSKKTIKKDDALLKKFTPSFVIISTAVDDKISWIKVGQLFERIWLKAVSRGLSCAPLAAPVQVGEYFKEIQKILNLKHRPQIFFRMGYCDNSVKHSPRLDIADVLK